MKAILKLIRVQNLIIIAFTQYMVRWCLINPILQYKGLCLQMLDFDFFLLVLSTVMIAAAGYIINDYFDINIDKINKPERLVIDHGVKRRVAILSHTVLNIVAVCIALYVSYKIGMWKLAIIHLFWTTGLWFYSTTFKRQFLIGNLIIAIFIVLVPLIVGIYELLACYKYYYAIGEKVSFKEIWRYVLMLSFFAGIVTLLREIIKDIEDYDGDKEYGCTTLPIVIGKFKTQVIASFLALITMLCLAYIQLKQLDANDMNAFYYFLFFLQVPFATLIYFTLKAKTKKQFALAGNITKLIMISGVCYLFLFAHYLFTL